MKTPQVYVIGGGFAGVQATRAAARRSPHARVTLIDRNEYATMIPALPDVLSGRIRTDALAQPLAPALGGDVELLIAEVEHMDLNAREIRTSDGVRAYDYLVVASGSSPAYFGFEPEDGRLHSVHTLDAALAFRRALEDRLSRAPHAPVVIVGAGYTGLEVASCLTAGAGASGATPRIIVVELADSGLGFLGERERARVLRYFESIGVEIRTGTSLERYAGGTAYLSDGESLDEALVCWAAGMRGRTDGIDGTLERTRDGRIITTPALQLPAHPEVFVAGDAAALGADGDVARRAVNFSFYSGRRAGANVAASIAGRPLRDFRPVDLGWIIPLGDESVGRVFGAIKVGGALGLRMHYTMCGFRRFAAGYAGEFYRTALHLSRNPDALSIGPGAAGGSEGAGDV
jgi:NADH dehydrogenase